MTDKKFDAPYKPISCDLHSQYELAIMHKSRLGLTWFEEGKLVTKTDITPVDVQTKNKAEYLIAHTASEDTFSIRLDRITQMRILK